MCVLTPHFSFLRFVHHQPRARTAHATPAPPAGALTIAFKNPDAYAAVSAFAPICNPSAVPWGAKVFGAYLGDAAAGKAHDATELLKVGAVQLFNPRLYSC